MIKEINVTTVSVEARPKVGKMAGVEFEATLPKEN